jgi:hypothetical protein
VALAVIGITIAGTAGATGSRSPAASAAAATGLSVDGCIEVEPGETFEVTILVADVTDILAWDILYSFNRRVVEVTRKDVGHILDALPNSNVFDLSDPVPNSTGTYRLGAADTGGTDAAESGSGILATLTLQAKAKGLSWSSIYRADVNGDGTVDIGPTLTALGGQHIGDNNGDGIFDGVISSGQIAVDRKCANPMPTAPPPSGVVVVSPATPTRIEIGAPGVSPSETPTPTGETPTPGQGSPTQTPTPVVVRPPDVGGGPGTPLSTWLIGLLAGSAAIGVVLSYVIYKSSRRLA